jgi:aryl-alcohol dehydrogenase-like predicted oxidoreductase
VTPIRIAGIDRPIPPLALGTGFYDPGQIDACFALLDAFIEGGGTALDTAPAYGRAEEVLGRWLEARGARDRVVIVTKCGHGADYRLAERGYRDMVRSELQRSLERLGTDVIDVHLLHRDNQEMPVAMLLEPLNEAIASGRVRAIGASNWEYRRVIEANDYAARHALTGFAVVSNTLTLAQPAAAFFPGLVHTDPFGEGWHRDSGIPLLAWAPLARGFFNGVVTPAMRADRALTDPPEPNYISRMLKVFATDGNFERLERARALAERKGCTATEIALAWLLHKPFPVVPIVGPRTPEELASCRRAQSIALTPEEIGWLEVR